MRRKRKLKGKENGARRWKVWLEKMRARGASEMELVVELHLCRGLGLMKVAEVLGLELRVVHGLWRRGRMGTSCDMKRPRTKAEYATLREQMGVVLWQTLVETFLGERANGGTAKRPAIMRVRMKALRQLGALYGVDLKKKPEADEGRAVWCGTPEEIARLVEEWVAKKLTVVDGC